MSLTAGAIRREQVESWMAERRDRVALASRSLQGRPLVQFLKLATDEDEIERSPMENLNVPRVADKPFPVIEADDFRKPLREDEGKRYNERRRP